MRKKYTIRKEVINGKIVEVKVYPDYPLFPDVDRKAKYKSDAGTRWVSYNKDLIVG